MNLPQPVDPPPQNLLDRHMTVQDAAGAVLFLMSPAASGMPGQVVNVCGGTLLD